MSLTRKFLEELGIDEDKISSIVDANADSVSGLTAERDKLRKKAALVDELQTELDSLKKQTESEESWKEKFTKEHEAFEAFKQETTEKETKAGKIKAYREMLKELKIDDEAIDSIINVTDFGDMDIEEGKLKDIDKHIETVKTKYKAFIPQETTEGATVARPPKTETVTNDLGSLSMEDYIAARTKK